MAVNGTNLIYIPNSTYPTAEVVAKSISDDAVDATINDLKFGWDDSGEQYYRGIITIKLPQLYDIYGDTTAPLYNSDTPVGSIVDLAFEIDPGNAITDLGKYHVYLVKKKQSQFMLGVGGSFGSGLPHDTKHISTDTVSWNGYAESEMTKDGVIDTDVTDTGIGTLEWRTPGAFIKGMDENGAVTGSGNTDIDQSTDYGHGPNGIIHMFNCEDASVNPMIPLAPLLAAKSYTWGDSFQLMIKHEGATDLQNNATPTDAEWGDEAHANVETLVDCTAGTFGGAVSSSFVKVSIIYEDAPPTKPIIKMSADPTDYITPIVTFDTFPTDSDIQSVAFHHNTSNAFTYNASPVSEIRTALTSFNKAEYRDLKGTNFLGTPGTTTYYLTAIAADNTNYIQGNVIAKTRMTCSGAVSSSTSIGTTITLTVTGTNGDYSGKFVKFGVNWDGNGTASNDSISDYSIVTLTEEATTATVTHTYDKADTYQINLFTIDRDGFRSDFTNAANTTAVSQPNPVAVLRASRDTAVRAKYGDEFSVINLSASHSYPVGSDRALLAHKFQHNSSTPVTTYPMENDNSNFNDATTTVKLKCNTANCADTVLKVFGKVSVSSDGTPNVDNDGNFDHYEYQVHEVSPSDTAETYGTVAQTGGENVLFKSVDFVVVSVLDPQDTGAVYTLADGDGNIINNKIRAAKDTDAWGGYVATSSMTVAFHTGNKTITRSSGSFLTDGFVPGDTIWVDGNLEDVGNNGFFTVSAVSATVITVNEDTLVTGDGSDAGVYIYKINGPLLPIASYTENLPTITCAVRQMGATQATTHSLQTSANVTQALRFVSEQHNTLDFDTIADAGEIAIQNASLKRGGGIGSTMPLGSKAYPVGATRTRMGSPTLSLSIRTLTQTGYRRIWNLIEGGRYEWATIDSKKVDAPSTAYKQLRMRLASGSLNKDPKMASHYTASLNFIVIGELVT
tara:strand:- start:1319 stop:4189 length:2871 start_codon:yes stop_codon:yes gene_type:complete